MSDTTVLTVPFDGVCARCNELIPQGSEGLHVPGTGLVHVKCPVVRLEVVTDEPQTEQVPEEDQFTPVEQIEILAAVADENLQRHWPQLAAVLSDEILESLQAALEAVQQIEKLAEKEV